MYPTGLKMYTAGQAAVLQTTMPKELFTAESSGYILKVADAAKEPLRDFLINNSSPKHRTLFFKMAYRVLPEEYRPGLDVKDFIILVPAYITSQHLFWLY